MKENFKNFIKKENKRKKIEYVNNFWNKHSDNILPIIYIFSLVFSLIFSIFADSSETYETNIISIKKIENSYVNSLDTLYTMTVKFDKDSITKEINLEKEKYIEYFNYYNKGITKYLYEDINWFYYICLFYLILNCIIFMIIN